MLVEEASAAGASEDRRRPVAVGRTAGGRAELLAGDVYSGDRVVVRGAHELGGFFAPTTLHLGPEAARGIGLRVEPAGSGDVDEVVTLGGAVDFLPADRGAAASPLVGTVTAVRVGRGDAVRAGDVPAEVYSPELLIIQLDLVRAILDLRLETATLERIKARSAAARRMWEAEGRVSSLRSQAESLRQELVTVGLTPAQVEAVERTRRAVPTVPVRKPVAGTVLAFERVIGRAVAVNVPLFAAHAAGRPWVRGFVPERDRGRAAVGRPARVRLVSDPNTGLTGMVTRGGRAIGACSRAESMWV